jgi:alpha-amylase/alpha-mannosidase (GH57 family)
MIKLRVAILWHYHQPNYQLGDEFILPWVRLHAVKDYWDLPEIFHEFPEIKQTINLVPSLSKQIEQYISGEIEDKIQRLTKIAPSELTREQKKEILRLFFLCNHDNMINPYNRFRELHEKSYQDNAIEIFEDRDWHDLQVWYNLTWIGNYSRGRSAVRRLFGKGQDFQEEDKRLVLEIHLEIMRQIRSQIVLLEGMGKTEISATPFNHPILPLLCDTDSARESMPDVILPYKKFSWPEDANAQIANAIKFYDEQYDIRPQGMWPSEGSISNHALGLMAANGVKWVASDEEVLKNSVGEDYDAMDKYFPHKFKTNAGDISVFFRDHNLSDAIGFEYSQWNSHDAAVDFCNRLRHIRSELVNKYGEEILEKAVVPIILDGENCWEFYHENGIHFLRSLYNELTHAGELRTITFSECLDGKSENHLPPIHKIKAGSWINGNFNIWIGHEEHRNAWSMLAETREFVESMKSGMPQDILEKVMEEIYIAEGSDWFWWYGDTHVAENKYDFDIMFRKHLENVYKIMGLKAPDKIANPISGMNEIVGIRQQLKPTSPVVNGRVQDDEEWTEAGYFDPSGMGSSMHQVGELLKRFWFTSDDDFVYFRFDLSKRFNDAESLEMKILSPKPAKLLIDARGMSFTREYPIECMSFEFSIDEIVEMKFSKKCVKKYEHPEKISVEIRTKSNEKDFVYPRQGSIELEL